MPAEVEQMFSVREVPWHLGVETTEDQVAVLDEYPGRAEAMRLAGHDFTVEEEPTYRRIVRKVEVVDEDGSTQEQEQVSFIEVQGYKYLVNDHATENNKVLHVASDSYTVVQPGVLYDLTEAILDVSDDVKWETGGTLSGGEVLWTLAKVDKPFFITKDPSPIFPYVVASTTNNGTGGVKVANIQMRIVCRNTFNAAEYESQDSGREFTFRHTRHVAQRIEEAKQVLAGATRQAKAFAELGEELAKVAFTDKAIAAFVEEFIPEPPGGVTSERVKANIAEARALVTNLFNSKTVDPAIRNTGYGAVMVGIEYLQYLRKGRGGNTPTTSTYLNRTLLRPEPLSNRLVPMVRRIADENKVSVLA